MLRYLIALALVAFATVFVTPGVAQQPPGTSAGVLTCKMAPSIGLIFGSRQRMACRFVPNGPYPPRGICRRHEHNRSRRRCHCCGAMAWGVFAPTAGPEPGALAGTYVGPSGSVGIGVGANVLFGGSGRSISLQPLSVEAS